MDKINDAQKRLVENKDHAAFSSLWEDYEDVQDVLRAIAHANGVDETNKFPQLNVDGILREMEKEGLESSREQVHNTLQRLLEEHILTKENNTYRFIVPLYQRWIKQWK